MWQTPENQMLYYQDISQFNNLSKKYCVMFRPSSDVDNLARILCAMNDYDIITLTNNLYTKYTETVKYQSRSNIRYNNKNTEKKYDITISKLDLLKIEGLKDICDVLNVTYDSSAKRADIIDMLVEYKINL